MNIRIGKAELRCMLWVALCFTLTSGVYLSWLDRAVNVAGANAADWLSMVAGYLFQAGGLGAAYLWLKRKADGNHDRAFQAAAVLLLFIAIPTLITNTKVGVTTFGWLMNGLCGVIAGGYLYGIGIRVDEERQSIVFGGGYAIATVTVGLLALVGNGILLHSAYALVAFVLMAAGLVWMTRSFRLPGANNTEQRGTADGKQISFAFCVVILVSLVKNLGFGFPSEDIAGGLIPEISRIPYAIGLAAAGLISARNRRNGMICTIAAMIIPFLMLGLRGEPISSTVFWGLDYVFFAFFTVFRVILFLDLAGRTKHWELAPLGLLAGRLGDAAGTAVYLLLGGYKTVLIGAAAALFIPGVFLLWRLYENIYDVEALQARMEREKFRAFCEYHDLSAREQDIFRLMMTGKTYGEIAGALFITENTVKYHVRNIFQKTGCRSRAELQRDYAAKPDRKREAADEESRPSLHIVS